VKRRPRTPVAEELENDLETSILVAEEKAVQAGLLGLHKLAGLRTGSDGLAQRRHRIHIGQLGDALGDLGVALLTLACRDAWAHLDGHRKLKVVWAAYENGLGAGPDGIGGPVTWKAELTRRMGCSDSLLVL
jgi:hypothetical protein